MAIEDARTEGSAVEGSVGVYIYINAMLILSYLEIGLSLPCHHNLPKRKDLLTSTLKM